jgi:hypothetical protein
MDPLDPVAPSAGSPQPAKNNDTLKRTAITVKNFLLNIKVLLQKNMLPHTEETLFNQGNPWLNLIQTSADCAINGDADFSGSVPQIFRTLPQTRITGLAECFTSKSKKSNK